VALGAACAEAATGSNSGAGDAPCLLLERPGGLPPAMLACYPGGEDTLTKQTLGAGAFLELCAQLMWCELYDMQDLSRRREHLHARALQIRADLSTHSQGDRPPATHTQFLEFSF